MSIMWWNFFVLLTIFCVVYGESVEEPKKNVSENNEREMRQYDSEKWRIVEYQPQDNSGWIPRDQQLSEEYQPKRRRLRKRKRRPPLIPLADPYSEEYQQRPLRRRIRPQRLDEFEESLDGMSEETARRPYIRRRITPIYFKEDADGVSMEGVSVSSIEESTVVRPSHQPPSEVPTKQEDKQQVQEKVRDPFTALEEAKFKQKPIAEDKTEPQTIIQHSNRAKSSTDLKAILKQRNSSLSLSEVLQKKNLTLAELLMGNKNAILALTEEVTNTPFEPTTLKEASKYKRLPPSVGLRKNTNKDLEQDKGSLDAMSSKETLEAQRRRLALLHGHRTNKIYSDVTKFDVVTEAMTERRIFIPSNSKHYTSANYLPDFIQSTEKMTDQGSTEIVNDNHIIDNITNVESKAQIETTTEKVMLRLKFKHRLPITSAKLNKATQSLMLTTQLKSKTTTLPPKAFKINLSELFGFQKDSNSASNKTELESVIPKNNYEDAHGIVKKDEPLKMTFDLDTIKSENTTKRIVELPTKALTQLEFTTTKLIPQTLNKIEASTKAAITEKIKEVTAREEIMDLLKDPVSRERLSRILELKNMTIQELVEQRERGSSQLHLADIFHNAGKEPEPEGEPFIGQMNPKYLKTLPKIIRQQKMLPFEFSKTEFKMPFTQPVSKDHVNVKSVDYEEGKRKENQVTTQTPNNIYTITSFPTYKIELDKNSSNATNQSFLPIWRKLYPDIFTTVHENSDQKFKSTKPTLVEADFIDLQRLEEIENKLSQVSSEKFNVDLSQNLSSEDEDKDYFISLPSGVKSAIIASMVIVGLSLLVFITILVIFRLSQKHKQRLCYRSSFSGSRIKSPILETAQQKKSLKSFMTETLGRKKNYYNSHLQSMSDSIWETQKKPF